MEKLRRNKPAATNKTRESATLPSYNPMPPAKAPPSLTLDRQPALHRPGQRYPGGAERGQQAEQNARENGNRHGESQDAAVKRKVQEHRIFGGSRCSGPSKAVPQRAKRIPTSAPAVESSTHSVSNWRISRERLGASELPHGEVLLVVRRRARSIRAGDIGTGNQQHANRPRP